MIDSAIRKAFQFEIGGNPVTLKLEVGVSGIGPSDPISREPGRGAPIFDFRPEQRPSGRDLMIVMIISSHQRVSALSHHPPPILATSSTSMPA